MDSDLGPSFPLRHKFVSSKLVASKLKVDRTDMMEDPALDESRLSLLFLIAQSLLRAPLPDAVAWN